MRQLTEEFVKTRVVKWLGRQDYLVADLKTLSEHGADIRARKARSRNFFIVECKGEPRSGPAHRYPAMLNVLGQIIRRMKHETHWRYGIALPTTCRKLVLGNIPWVASKRLGLEILLIDAGAMLKESTGKI